MATCKSSTILSYKQAIFKRLFDICMALMGLLLTWWIIILSWCASTLDTCSNGFFLQNRVGKDGKFFKVIKIRTMKTGTEIKTTVTTHNDARITKLGRFFRKTKVDELPQLLNVLKGDMSFVGPRPDVPGFADLLKGEDRLVLSVRPGITGPATLIYRNEELLLSEQNDPEFYNRNVLWPNKVRLNCRYVQEWTFKKDLIYIWKTLFH